MKVKQIISWITESELQKKQDKWKALANSLFSLEHADEITELQPYVNEVEDFDEYREDILIKELIEKEYIICGDTHQVLAIPVYEDGYLILSMRKWNEVMKKAYYLSHSAKFGYSGLGHNFYLASLCVDKEVLPNAR